MLGGRKLGGILCEARWHGERLGWVAVGIGMNVANAIPDPVQDSAIALGAVAPGATAESLAAPIAGAVAEAGRRQGLLSPDELDQFRGRDWLLGKSLLQPGRGTAEGVSAHGSLLIREGDEMVRGYRTGTVALDGNHSRVR
jgi:biotin-(acetyl-CoA carboxylase) ligase